MKPFMIYHGGKPDEVRVYHTYTDPHEPQNRMETEGWFSTDETDIDSDYSSGAQFDVRDLSPDAATWAEQNGVRYQVLADDATLRRIIRQAIEDGRVKAPE